MNKFSKKIYSFLKNKKPFSYFFRIIKHVENFILTRKKKLSSYCKRKIYLFKKRRRLNSIKITRKEASDQIEQLLDNIKRVNLKQNFNSFVSIIILNRNGLSHLNRLFKSLKENTIYPNYEIIVIDNGSSDGSIEFINKNEFDLPIRLIANKENVSFSRGCNQGALEAKGNLLVFMNNDIQVFPNWLTEMVGCYLSDEKKIGSVGAKLIYPKKEKFKFSNRLQHTGIRFEFDPGEKFYRPYNFGMGESVLNYNKQEEYPALTAALLLVPKDKFEKIGGFDEKYFYGYEDVDFGLKLLKAGYKNISCPSACAFHYEFGTQKNDQNNEIAERRKNNLEIFRKRWGAFLTQKVFEDCLCERSFYCEEDFCVYLVFDNENQKQSLEFKNNIKKKTGWKIELINSKSFFRYRIKSENGLLISFSTKYDIGKIKNDSPNLVKISWMENETDEWLKKDYLASFDLFFSSENLKSKEVLEIIKNNHFLIEKENSYRMILQKIIEAVKEKKAKPKIAIKIPIPNWKEAESWGDYHFALSLKKYFKRRNWNVIIQFLPDWDKDLDRDCSVVLALRGLSFYETKPYHFNMMWNISHPDVVQNEEYESYDHVFIASRVWAEKVQNETKNVEVESLLQCTDGDVFSVPNEEDLIGIEKEKLLFVGNSRKEYRLSVRHAIENGFDVAVYGKLWEEFIDKKYIRGSYLDNRSLYKHYYLSEILLNDHWHDMAEKGFVSNRIFDGLASGAVVLTDYVEGVEKEDFYDFLNIYEDKEDFLNKANYILDNKKEFREKALRGFELVLKNHTFEKRVDRFIEVINSQ